MEEKLVNRILKLENELKSTKYLVVFLILMFIVLSYQYISVQQKSQLSVDLIRTRGLIIQDEMGREVMMVGKPIPFSSQRKRTDAREGLLMIDENGNDRLFIGKQGPHQVEGKRFNRIDERWGFLVNDENGNERGGFGMLDSLNSMVMGLNYPGGEGIMLVTEPAHAYMVIHSDTEGIPKERLILSHEMNTVEKTLIKISDHEADDRIIIRAISEKDPQLEYRKRSNIKNDLFQ